MNLRPASPRKPEPTVSLREHMDTVHALTDKFLEERDRRYTEVALEREKALKIKETADAKAMELAREIQIYKDEKANELREQIGSERHLYATKQDLDAAVSRLEVKIDPLVNFMQTTTGRAGGIKMSTGVLVGSLGAVATLLTVIIVVVNIWTGNS